MIQSEKTLATSKILAQSIEKLNNSKILDSSRTEKKEKYNFVSDNRRVKTKKLTLESKFNSPRQDEQLKWMKSKDGDLKALLSPRPPSSYRSPEDFIIGDNDSKKVESLPDQSRG